VRPALQGVGALAGFDLGELGDWGEVLGLGEPADGRLLGLDAGPGTARTFERVIAAKTQVTAETFRLTTVVLRPEPPPHLAGG